MKCEDYPCCGHTDDDPCERQWYDEPGAFDVTRPGNEHALCDHEIGECLVDGPDSDEEYDDEGESETGFSVRYLHWRIRRRMRAHFFSHGLFARDFGHRRLFIRRRMRAAFLDVEWHNYSG